jgi:CBS domain-containing protein
MNIGFICQRQVITVDRTSTLMEAAALMREHHVGAVVVVDESLESSQVMGVLTDRDIVISAVANGLDITSTPVGELSSGDVLSVSETVDISAAIDIMRRGGVRRLLVTDEEQQLIGVVSLDDLLDALATEIDGMVEVIRNGLQHEERQRPSHNGKWLGPGDGPLPVGGYHPEQTLG